METIKINIKPHSLHQAVRETTKSVLTGSWSQSRAFLPKNWRNLNSAHIETCIGIKLYMHFYRDFDQEFDSNFPKKDVAGIDAFAKRCAGNRLDVIALFQQFCNSQDPFDGTSWHTNIEDAWNILFKTERFPSLCGGNFSHTELQFANLDSAVMERANMMRADLTHAKLPCVHGAQGNWNCADLSYANLGGADLERTDLFQARAYQTNFHLARLQYADMRFMKLHGANFRHADLSHANLQYAELISTDLSQANLSHADLSHVKIIDTDFSKVSGLESADMTDKERELIR